MSVNRRERALDRREGHVRRYCTYFDHRYLSRGLALFRSLTQHVPGSELWVLCLDDTTLEALGRLAIPGVTTVSLTSLETASPELLAVRATRTLLEYYFTCKPTWMDYVIRRSAPSAVVTYLDADLCFYADPTPIEVAMEGHDAAIIPHRFPPWLVTRERYGVYNAGLVAARNSSAGRAIVDDWRLRCLAWCYDRVDQGRFGDQKYLDDWPRRFGAVAVIDHPSAGLAPWNCMRYPIEFHSAGPTVDGEPLVFYHFHGFRALAWRFYDTGSGPYGRFSGELVRSLYHPYAMTLASIEDDLRGMVPGSLIRAPRPRANASGLGRRLLSGFRRGSISIRPSIRTGNVG